MSQRSCLSCSMLDGSQELLASCCVYFAGIELSAGRHGSRSCIQHCHHHALSPGDGGIRGMLMKACAVQPVLRPSVPHSQVF